MRLVIIIWAPPKNNIFLFWYCLMSVKFLIKSLGIASKLKENGPEEGKISKFSACGGLGSKKKF